MPGKRETTSFPKHSHWLLRGAASSLAFNAVAFHLSLSTRSTHGAHRLLLAALFVRVCSPLLLGPRTSFTTNHSHPAAAAPAMKRERSGDGDETELSPLKRARGEAGAEPNGKEDPAAAAVNPGAGAEDDDDEQIALPKSTTRSQVKQGRECPYLDTVSRQVRGARGLRVPLQGGHHCRCPPLAARAPSLAHHAVPSEAIVARPPAPRRTWTSTSRSAARCRSAT